MVDTAIFSIFHRAPPPPPPPEPVAAPAPVPPAPAVSAAVEPPPEPPAAPDPVAEPILPDQEVAASPPPDPAPTPIHAEVLEPEPAVAEAPEPSPVPPEPAPVHDLAPPAAPLPEALPPIHHDPEPAVAVETAPEPTSEPELAPDVEEPEFDAVPVPMAEPEAAWPEEAVAFAPADAEPPAISGAAPDTVWFGPAELTEIPVAADQLGLASPVVITLLARLADFPAVELDASQSGIYRPQGFRVAPWSGFAYDQAEDGRTGFAAGTRILTSRGEMEVERLLPGDTALTLRAPALLPIAWIGKSSATAAPILIEAGALGPNLPRRPLCLAPDQPIYVEPVPVTAGRLVNGTTIRPLDSAEVDLFHVDVGRAEILFAEGVALSSSDRNRVQAAQ